MSDTIELNPEVSVEKAPFVPMSETERTQALAYLPTEVAEEAATMLCQEQYGYIGLTDTLRRMVKAYTRFQAHKDSALKAIRRERAEVDITVSTRNKNRNFLASLEDTLLQKYCEKYEVSYASFMATNDKANLIEAILDEMLLVP